MNLGLPQEPDDDSIDINPRPLDEIYLRAVALITLARRGFIEESAPSDRQSDDYYEVETNRFDLYSWSRRELQQALVTSETAILHALAGTLDSDATDQCFDALVAAEVLGWSIGLIEELPDPAYLEEEAIDLLLDWAPGPWRELKRTPQNLAVRSDQEIADERERRELWYWRLSIDPDDYQDGDELLSVISETVHEASLAGLLQVSEGDFSLVGTSVASLSADQQAGIELISRIQLQSLNWVAGLGEDWDSVPLMVD